MESVIAWVGLIIVVITHLVTVVWWAAKTSTILSMLQKSVESIFVELKATAQIYVKKEDCKERMTRELTMYTSQKDAIWRNIDTTKAEVKELREIVLTNQGGQK